MKVYLPCDNWLCGPFPGTKITDLKLHSYNISNPMPESPLFNKILASLPEETIQRVRRHIALHKRIIGSLTGHYGESLEMIVLFGSRARGEATPDSDIDLLVVLDDAVFTPQEYQKWSEWVSETLLETGELIHFVFTSRSLYQAGGNAFYEAVKRDGVVVWGKASAG